MIPLYGGELKRQITLFHCQIRASAALNKAEKCASRRYPAQLTFFYMINN